MTEPPSEPQITINGHQLGTAQALTVRLALSSMLVRLDGNPKALGDDSQGRVSRAAYIDNLHTLLSMCGIER